MSAAVPTLGAAYAPSETGPAGPLPRGTLFGHGSAFHRHFKAVTTLSPLQYQKQVRLLQARTLLLATGHNVTSVAHEVGYESSTQFSREYARAFGLPPAKDAARITAVLR